MQNTCSPLLDVRDVQWIGMPFPEFVAPSGEMIASPVDPSSVSDWQNDAWISCAFEDFFRNDLPEAVVTFEAQPSVRCVRPGLAWGVPTLEG